MAVLRLRAFPSPQLDPAIVDTETLVQQVATSSAPLHGLVSNAALFEHPAILRRVSTEPALTLPYFQTYGAPDIGDAGVVAMVRISAACAASSALPPSLLPPDQPI